MRLKSGSPRSQAESVLDKAFLEPTCLENPAVAVCICILKPSRRLSSRLSGSCATLLLVEGKHSGTKGRCQGKQAKPGWGASARAWKGSPCSQSAASLLGLSRFAAPPAFLAAKGKSTYQHDGLRDRDPNAVRSERLWVRHCVF